MSINVKKYLAKFESTSAYNTFATSNDYVTPNVSLIEENGTITGIMYNPYVASTPEPSPIPAHDYSLDYFTIEALESGTLNITTGNNGYLQYSLDGGETWSEQYGSIEDLSLNVNNKILLKGDITLPDGLSGGNHMSYTGDFNVYGNIMSLVYGDNFANQTSLAGKDWIFFNFFQENETLLSAENLILPTTTLADYCYEQMFSGCTSLITVPELPATTLTENCYESMFSDCTSLTTAPELPATTLAGSCYSGMFYGCTSLTTAPELPATTLASWCYNSMFYNCTSLTTAPELPATKLVDCCYQNMFNGCTSLNSITCLATNISANECTYYWVDGVAASGTFTKATSMTGWTTGINGIPSGWTIQDYVAS